MADVKRQFVDLVLQKIDENYEMQHEKITKVAHLFGDCMMNGGVVQLFGHKLNEEFVNELNFRAGGITPFHAIKAKDAALRGLLDKSLAQGEFLNHPEVIDTVLSPYILDDRDMYCLISMNGNEPFVLELAKKVKANGQKLVVVTNMATYRKSGGTLVEYADEYLDFGAEEPDLAVEINGAKYGQWGTTIGSVIAQQITAELYNYFMEKEGHAPVLLSANLHGSDKHNNDSVLKYGGKRIR